MKAQVRWPGWPGQDRAGRPEQMATAFRPFLVHGEMNPRSAARLQHCSAQPFRGSRGQQVWRLAGLTPGPAAEQQQHLSAASTSEHQQFDASRKDSAAACGSPLATRLVAVPALGLSIEACRLVGWTARTWARHVHDDRAVDQFDSARRPTCSRPNFNGTSLNQGFVDAPLGKTVPRLDRRGVRRHRSGHPRHQPPPATSRSATGFNILANSPDPLFMFQTQKPINNEEKAASAASRSPASTSSATPASASPRRTWSKAISATTSPR